MWGALVVPEQWLGTTVLEGGKKRGEKENRKRIIEKSEKGSWMDEREEKRKQEREGEEEKRRKKGFKGMVREEKEKLKEQKSKNE